jgi:hypothetical protein
MQNKTKFISFLLLILLALPLVINPTRQGSVLGVQENTDQNIQVGLQESNNGQIGEGVMENKLKNSSSDDLIKGYAVLDKQAKSSVTAKNIALASEIKVQNDQKTAELIVSNVDSGLAEDVVLVVDEKTFESLGGDSKNQDKVLVTIQKSN